MYRSHIECLPCINTDSFPSLPKQLLRPLMWSHHTSHIKLVMILIINNFLTLCNKRLCLYHFSRLFTAQTDPLLPQTGASHHRSVWANTELWPSPPCQVLKANLDQNALLITGKKLQMFLCSSSYPPTPFSYLKESTSCVWLQTPTPQILQGCNENFEAQGSSHHNFSCPSKPPA